MTRQRNDGLRKICGCPRRQWAKCSHPWHFNFKWAGEHYRFCIEYRVNRVVRDAKGTWQRDRASLGADVIDSKTGAEQERDRLRSAIRAGTLQQQPDARPQRDSLTLKALMDAYRKQHIAVHRPDTIKNTDYVIGAIMRTALDRADGERRAFGDWLVSDITTDVIEQYRQARLPKGATGANRHLELLRSLFNWAASSKRKLATDNPFLDGTRAAVKLLPEMQRRRRLQAGEADRLLKACNPHLWSVVQCAIETGMRRGEILSLQWSQVQLTPKPEIFLPAVKTKTKVDRTIPVSSTLKAILEMRRNGPDGKEHPADAYVFGNEAGEAVKSFKRAWQRALLLAHGLKPAYVTKTIAEDVIVKTALLTPESQQRLRAIDLHFHDLRREAGSRWLDAGVPLHRIQKWLGHTNIAQTSTYLMADSADDDAAMQRFEEAQTRLQRIATEVGKGRRKRARTATMPESGPQLSSVRHH